MSSARSLNTRKRSLTMISQTVGKVVQKQYLLQTSQSLHGCVHNTLLYSTKQALESSGAWHFESSGYRIIFQTGFLAKLTGNINTIGEDEFQTNHLQRILDVARGDLASPALATLPSFLPRSSFVPYYLPPYSCLGDPASFHYHSESQKHTSQHQNPHSVHLDLDLRRGISTSQSPTGWTRTFPQLTKP
jgi:hypothetical protein